MRALRCSILGVTATLLAAAASAAGEEVALPFSETVSVEIVNLDVYVRDRSGEPVTGLRAADFELYEDGKPVPVSNFYAVDGGRRVAEENLGVEGAAAPEQPSAPPDAGPSFLVAFVDNHNLSAFHRNRALDQLEDFLRRRMNEGDLVMLASYDGAVRVEQKPTSSSREVAAAIARLKVMAMVDAGPEVRQRRMLEELVAAQLSVTGPLGFSTVGQEAEDAGGPDQPRVAQGGLREFGHRPCESLLGELARNYARSIREDVRRTLEALGQFTDSLAGLPGRKSVLYLSDGLPLVPGQEAFELLHQLCGGGASTAGVAGAVNDATLLGPEALNVQALQLEAASFSAAELFRRLTERANGNGVTFFTLEATGPRPPSSSLAETESRYLTFQSVDFVQRANFQDSLSVMAAETGGQAVLNAGDLGSALAAIASDLDSFYSLGYRLTGPAGGDVARRIEVKVKRPGVEVRYRRSLHLKTGEQRLADLTVGSLLFGVEDNPLGLTLEVGEPVALDGTLFSVPIRVSIPLGKLTLLPRDGSHVGRLSLQVGARDRQGRLAPVRAAAIPISIPDARLAEARGKLYLYEVKMLMRAGDHAVAVGLRDEIGAVASFLLAEVPVAAR